MSTPALVSGLTSVLLLALIGTGVGPAEAALLTAVVVVQGASGAVWWLWARGSEAVPAIELVGMGLALGTLGALLSAQLLRTTFLGDWAWLAPSAVTLAASLLVAAHRRSRRHPHRSSSEVNAAQSGGLAAGLVLGLFALIPFWRSHPLSWQGWWAYYVDIPFHEALARSLSRYGPNDSVFAVGSSIRYHWFSHAWIGSVETSTGAAPFVVLTRLVPLVALIATACVAWAWARRLSDIAWVPTVAVVLVVGGTWVGGVDGNLLIPLSPSQSFSTPWLLGLSLVLTEFLYRRLACRPAVALLWLLAVGCVGGKVSHAVVAAGGIALLAAVSLRWDKALRKRVWTAAAAAGLGVIMAFVLVIAGGNGNGLAFSIRGLPRAAASSGLVPAVLVPLEALLGSIALVLAILARLVGFAWLLRDRESRRRPEVVYGFGVGATGLLAMAVTTHPGGSQIYFALSASAVVSVLSASGVGLLASPPALEPTTVAASRPQVGTRHWLLAAAAVGGLTGVVASLLYRSPQRLGVSAGWLWPAAVWLAAGIATIGLVKLRRRRRAGQPLAALIFSVVLLSSSVAALAGDTAITLLLQNHPSAHSPNAWTADHAAAADWLASHAEPRDVVATNRFCSNITQRPPSCSSTWFLTSALTGLRMFIEGYDYGVGVGVLPPWAQKRVELSTRFANQPNARDARALWDEGVRWVWVDRAVTTTRSWEPHASVAFSNDVVTVLRLKSQ